KFVGMGEKLEDLEPFHPDRMASRILGMGDVLTLIDKAQERLDEKAAEKTVQRLKENKFDMNDLLDQMQQLRKMGPLEQVLSMLPGAGKIQLKDEDAQKGEAELRRMEAIIQSMTKKEREKPSIINPARKRRIAAGSGTRVEDVNRVLRQHEQMQKMLKQFSNPGKMSKKMMRRMGGMPGMGGMGGPGFPGF
ncbi:MAG: signal recognition particle protein, partial [Oscillospiraceae bacterium]|nr:signal recognition particle protein [Oscillospiraceae bacterium]